MLLLSFNISYFSFFRAIARKNAKRAQFLFVCKRKQLFSFFFLLFVFLFSRNFVTEKQEKKETRWRGETDRGERKPTDLPEGASARSSVGNTKRAELAASGESHRLNLSVVNRACSGWLVKIRSARSILPERNRRVRVNFLPIVSSSSSTRWKEIRRVRWSTR